MAPHAIPAASDASPSCRQGTSFVISCLGMLRGNDLLHQYLLKTIQYFCKPLAINSKYSTQVDMFL